MAVSKDDYAQRLRDLKAGTKIIMDTNGGRLGWLLGFIAEDPEKWHSTELAVRGDCLHALGRGGFPDNLVGGINLPEPMKATEVAALQKELRAMLRALLGETLRIVPIPTQGLTVALILLSGVGEKPALFGVTYGHVTARTAVFQAVKDLILREGDRLLACPVCSNPFLAFGRRKHCSRECTNRAVWQNYPEKKKQRARKRQYAKHGWTLGARSKRKAKK